MIDKLKSNKLYIKYGVIIIFIAIVSVLTVKVIGYWDFLLDRIVFEINEFFSIIAPIIYAILLAYLLYQPIKYIDKFLCSCFNTKKYKTNKHEKFIRFISVLIVIGAVIVLLILVYNFLIPPMLRSINEIIQSLPEFQEQLKIWTNEFVKQLNNKNIDVQNTGHLSGAIINGYSINQESVDLNSYLYAEKVILKEIAKILGYQEEAIKYEAEAKFVKEYINDNMFDEETGYYYDLQISEDGKKKSLLINRGMGPEGWIPLWAKVALPSRAKRIMENMMCETKFNSVMPLGTAALDNPSFQPQAYWRGPVWMDQAYFGVQGLMNYGYKEEAVELALKLINNGEGLIGEGTIRENYNPLTGKGLDATNFSWSSAVYLRLYQEVLAGEYRLR